MTTTYMRIDKDQFHVIVRSLNILINEGRLKDYNLEVAEFLAEQIQLNILGCGTTRQNWQIVDWNDPADKSYSRGRKQYDHYGDFE